MVTLTREMKNMIATQQCFVGTVSFDGTPNVAPKRSTRVLSENSLIFTESTGGATYENIKRGSKISVSVVNRDILEGFRFIGRCHIYESRNAKTLCSCRNNYFRDSFAQTRSDSG